MNTFVSKFISHASTLLLIGMFALWSYDLFGAISYNSVLFSNEAGNSGLNWVAGIVLLSAAAIILACFWKSGRHIYANLAVLTGLSAITLLILRNNLYFYMPGVRYESFNAYEMLYIYYSIIAVVFSAVGFICTIRRRVKQ